MQLQPAACVRDPGSCRATAYGIMVLTIDGSIIGEITGFADRPCSPPSGYLEA